MRQQCSIIMKLCQKNALDPKCINFAKISQFGSVQADKSSPKRSYSLLCSPESLFFLFCRVRIKKEKLWLAWRTQCLNSGPARVSPERRKLPAKLHCILYLTLMPVFFVTTMGLNLLKSFWGGAVTSYTTCRESYFNKCALYPMCFF